MRSTEARKLELECQCGQQCGRTLTVEETGAPSQRLWQLTFVADNQDATITLAVVLTPEQMSFLFGAAMMSEHLGKQGR